MLKKKKIYPTYVSKKPQSVKNKAFFLMTPNGDGWHYFAVKNLYALLRRISSKHDGNFYCLNCLHPFRTKNKPESHKNGCENKNFRNVLMSHEDT